MTVDLKYNYVIFGNLGYYEVGYHDLFNLDNVKYFPDMEKDVKSKFALFVQKITFSSKVNKITKFPFKKYTFKHLYPFKFNNNRPIIFILFGRPYLPQSGYIDYLREKYPSSRMVLYFQDTVDRYRSLYYERSKFDLVMSYDKQDCSNYGLVYYPTPYSKISIKEISSISETDVFYCGYAKTRYPKIFAVYNECKKRGLKCRFYIMGVPEEAKILSEEIIYDKPISYEENLQYVVKCKCILEIMQDGAVGYTPRLWESIVYDKHLLTNNKSLLNSSLYNNSFMHQVVSMEDIGSWIDSPVHYSVDVKDNLSPIHLLEKIESLI